LGIQRAAPRFRQSVPTAPALPRSPGKSPLLITSDTHTIQIHTNFNNYPIQTHVVRFDDILKGDGVEKLTWAFFTPERFKPEKSRQRITKATADSLLRVADEMKKHRDILGVGSYSNEQLAHFLVRLLFALFAEDMGLLPDNLFTQIVRVRGGDYAHLQATLRELFNKMRGGGAFGLWPIRHFNGALFDDDFVPDIPHDLGKFLLQAAEQDWSQIDPSIFGTLFERVIDEGKRAQLGAHYTSEADIMLIVEPVLMAPLKRRWDDLRRELSGQLGDAPSEAAQQAAHERLAAFAAEIAAQRVLDPSCGSGNFLYVALRELLNLQKEVVAFAARWELPPVPLTAGPEQLYGIEINAYAHELAQITVWIGYLQWRHENGFSDIDDPVLRPLTHIKRMDAILAYDEAGKPVEPEWPAAEVIIGNPPFLGDKKMKSELGHDYVDKVRKIYSNHVPGGADLVTYWFEKARKQIEYKKAHRAGLIATNSIRGGANREVLDRIKQTGDIFMAWSNNEWVLEGAAVRVSIIGFDNRIQQEKILDGTPVQQINSDLTSATDLTRAIQLIENSNLSFIGTQKGGAFELTNSDALKMLADDNQNGLNNSDVVKPWINGLDIVRRPRNLWIIYFPEGFSETQAAQYKLPFEYVVEHIKPERLKNSDRPSRVYWWLHQRVRGEMNLALAPLSRYAITARVSKHRVFIWSDMGAVPDSATVVIAREDDYFFGVLHSRLHEISAILNLEKGLTKWRCEGITWGYG
jgi:type II restriction/modification system DNA methylase subunit YeeA